MIFDLISDLHVDMNDNWDDQPSYDGVSSIYPWHLEKKSDIIVIAGDNANNPTLALQVIDEAREFYDHVIFVDGNHDHYIGNRDTKQTVGKTSLLYRQYMVDHDAATYLDGDTWLELDGTLFIGANGWYDWTAHSWTSRQQQHQLWKTGMADSSMIRFDEKAYPDKLATRDAERLREAVEWAQDDDTVRDIVVVTHTIPHRKGLVPDNHEYGPLNGSFHNALMGQVWIADKKKKIKSWCFGHTHFAYDFDAEGIRFVCNPRGYKFEDIKNNHHRGIIQIDTDETPMSAFSQP